MSARGEIGESGVSADRRVTFIVVHRHDPQECRFAFAAWKGFDSPLRRQSVLGTCAAGDHALWWTIDGANEAEVRRQLPPFVAERSEFIRATRLPIP